MLTRGLARGSNRWVFVGEATVKITGLGLRAYFSDGFNIFDFVVIVGAVLLKWVLPGHSTTVLGHRLDFLRCGSHLEGCSTFATLTRLTISSCVCHPQTVSCPPIVEGLEQLLCVRVSRASPMYLT